MRLVLRLVPGTLERPRAGMLANPVMRVVPGTLERPRAGMLANPSMRLVPGTLVSPRVGMLAKELGVWWEKLANFDFREACGGPGSSCGLSDHKSRKFFDYPGFVEVLVLD